MKNMRTKVIYGLLVSVPLIVLVVFMNVMMAIQETGLLLQISKNILVLVLVGVYVYYLFLYHSHLKLNKVLFIIAISAFMMIPSLFLFEQSFLLMPILVSVMLIAIVVDQQVAIMTHIITVLIIGVIGQMTLMFFIYYIMVGIVSALLIVHAKERTQIIYVAGIVTVFSVVFYNIIAYALEVPLEWQMSLLAAANGALTIIIVVGSLPFWESIFKVVTPIKLLELISSEHKLLQRLIVEAPGTYHHSKMVSNLAERAASALGADALLARTGSLYHDIGKMKQPGYFIENQNGGANPHDDISADSSAKIIIDHVDYGVKLGKEFKLPRSIIEIIKQHHGTSLVGYFYHKAQNYGDGIDYEESVFRYHGPKPSTKEAAIVMLADCVEAYVKSLDEGDRTLERIKEIVGEVTLQKIKEKQMDDCDISLKELPLITDAFIQVYNGMYHERVKYPTNR